MNSKTDIAWNYVEPIINGIQYMSSLRENFLYIFKSWGQTSDDQILEHFRIFLLTKIERQLLENDNTEAAIIKIRVLVLLFR